MAAIDEALMISLGIVNRDSSDAEKDDMKTKIEALKAENMEKQIRIDHLGEQLQECISDQDKKNEEFIKLETERNLYKTLYEHAILTMIGNPREVRT